MKKMRVVLSVVLAFCLCFGLAACNTSDTEVAPTITITSAEGNITTSQSYTLAYTAENAKETTVTVSEKSGITTGAYNSETKVFSATAAGEYTLTVKATNVSKTAEASVKVLVTLPADTTAPIIVFATEPQAKYTFTAGASVKLPLATATDDKDGSLDVNVEVTSKGASIAKENDGFVFSSKTAGTYKVSYYAIDAAENETEKFLTVEVAPVKAETTITEEENNLNNLNSSDVTFKENFKDGYSGAFAKGLTFPSVDGGIKPSIEALDDSIAGNSLIIDYSTCAADANTQYFFSGVSDKIKSGRWSVSMDVTLLGGTVPGNGLYFSFIYDGNNDGDNKIMPLGAVGETKTLSYSEIKTFDQSKNWHFRIFFYNGDSNYKYENLKIAIDNISFTWKDVEDSTAVRTGTSVAITAEDLIGDGYTITGTDENYTALGGRTSSDIPSSFYLYKSKLVTGDRLTAEQAANLTPENGFNSDYVVFASTQINSFNSLKNLALNPLYDYTLTFNVYSPSTDGWHIFFTDGSGNQAGSSYQQSELTGAGTFTATFPGSADKVHLGLYNGGSTSLYIGDITLSAKLHVVGDTTPNGHQVGKTWTFDGDADDFTPVGGAKFTRVNTADETLAAGGKLSAQAGFKTRAYKTALSGDSTNEIINSGAYFEASCEYEVTFVVYVESITGTLKIRFDSDFPDLTNKTGLQTIKLTKTGAAGFTSFYTGGDSSATVYLSSMQIKLTKIN